MYVGSIIRLWMEFMFCTFFSLSVQKRLDCFIMSKCYVLINSVVILFLCKGFLLIDCGAIFEL